MASTRFLFAGGVLYLWMRLRGVPNPTRLNSRAGLIIGGLLLLGSNGGVTWSEQYGPSSLAAVMVGAIPAWLVGGLFGIALLAGPSNLLGGESFNTLGIVALLIATLTWAIGSLFAARAAATRPADGNRDRDAGRGLVAGAGRDAGRGRD